VHSITISIAQPQLLRMIVQLLAIGPTPILETATDFLDVSITMMALYVTQTYLVREIRHLIGFCECVGFEFLQFVWLDVLCNVLSMLNLNLIILYYIL
jgi:hypothetical protein